MLDSLFTDGMYSDLERLTQLNQIVNRAGPIATDHGTLRRIDMLVILPSQDLSEIARHHARSLPKPLRALLRTMGAMNSGGGELMSYLMFQDSFTRELIALGYQDGQQRANDLRAFLGGLAIESSGASGLLRRLSLRQEQRAQAQQ